MQINLLSIYESAASAASAAGDWFICLFLLVMDFIESHHHNIASPSTSSRVVTSASSFPSSSSSSSFPSSLSSSSFPSSSSSFPPSSSSSSSSSVPPAPSPAVQAPLRTRRESAAAGGVQRREVGSRKDADKEEQYNDVYDDYGADCHWKSTGSNTAAAADVSVVEFHKNSNQLLKSLFEERLKREKSLKWHVEVKQTNI